MPLSLKKLEEIKAVWIEKGEGGSAAWQVSAALYTFRCDQRQNPSGVLASSGIFTVMNLPGLPVEVSRPLSLPAWSEESR